jgi:hypothetical protein
LSIAYEKGSMKNIDKDGDGKDDTLQLRMINKVGSGSVTADLKLYVDGMDMTEATTLQIAERNPERVKPSMYLYSNYGDTVLMEIKHDGKIGLGHHKVSLQATVGWENFSSDIEDTIQ